MSGPAGHRNALKGSVLSMRKLSQCRAAESMLSGACCARVTMLSTTDCWEGKKKKKGTAAS